MKENNDNSFPSISVFFSQLFETKLSFFTKLPVSFSKGSFLATMGKNFFSKTIYHYGDRKINFFLASLILLYTASSHPFNISTYIKRFSHFFEKVERTKPLEWIYPLVKIYIDEFLATQSDWEFRICVLGFLRSIWTNPAEKNMLLIVYWS